MNDELTPDELTEGTTVRLEWSPKRNPGAGGTTEGEVTRIWRPENDVREFTVRATDETIWNVYTEYRDPPVERVEGGDEADEEPETETVGRLERVVRTGR
ncbi:hypothetical protein [Haladaptatus sp. NG-SE-30]